jgi:hypothetical protein
MKYGIKMVFVMVVIAVTFSGMSLRAQVLEPSPVEKELAAKASDVTEVTLDKAMLGMAAAFMKDPESADTRKLISGLDGIYVRTYEFDKAGQFTPEQIEQLRKHYLSSEWQQLVKERSLKKDGESTDVLIKMVNGEQRGMFVLSVEPKEVSLVLILGPIKMEDLGKLNGLGAGLNNMVGNGEKNNKEGK